VGVGYYPNSTFVHLDVRSLPTYWVDYSKPGEPPRYDSANADADADEGTSDVSEEIHAAIGSDPASSSDGGSTARPTLNSAPTPVAIPTSSTAAPAAPKPLP